MAKRTRVLMVGAALLAIGGTVVASNMGFKFVPNYDASGAGNTFTISIPLNNNYTDAQSIINDIAASGCTPSQVTKINTNNSAKNCVSTGPLSPCSALNNFAVTKGEGYEVKVNTANCTTWVVVGSHDPAFPYSFTTPGASYLASIPYHTTALNAADIFTSVPSATTVTRVLRSGLKVNYTGNTAINNFAVVIGDAYFIKVSAPSSWTPPHY